MSRSGFDLVPIAAAATLVSRRRWLEALDRRFFRERYHSEQVLRHVAAQLRHATDPSEAIAAVIDDVDGALQPVYVAAVGNRLLKAIIPRSAADAASPWPLFAATAPL